MKNGIALGTFIVSLLVLIWCLRDLNFYGSQTNFSTYLGVALSGLGVIYSATYLAHMVRPAGGWKKIRKK